MGRFSGSGATKQVICNNLSGSIYLVLHNDLVQTEKLQTVVIFNKNLHIKYIDVRHGWIWCDCQDS